VSLNAKLRVQMRTTVARPQNQLGTTIVYVTHDQVEAMTLGDRVAVMRRRHPAGRHARGAVPAARNLFVAGFIGSPAMNFMPVRVEGDVLKLPMADVRLPDELRAKVGGDGSGQLIAGIRPEDFEDASLVGDVRDRGASFRAHIEVLESMGSELYAHFSVAADQQLESQELRELAEDAGAAEVPSSEEGQTTARLDPASRVREGDDAELWLDATRIHLFDAGSGESLRARS
jgi:multiple sugar transport system ATP-binding protein